MIIARAFQRCRINASGPKITTFPRNNPHSAPRFYRKITHQPVTHVILDLCLVLFRNIIPVFYSNRFHESSIVKKGHQVCPDGLSRHVESSKPVAYLIIFALLVVPSL